MNSLLGTVTPDPVGVILKTGYQRFERADGVAGLFKTEGRRLDLLALVSNNDGQGLVRSFIGHAKRNYDLIYIWHVENPILKLALIRYEFQECYEPFSIEGKVEWCEGMMWERESVRIKSDTGNPVSHSP